MFIEILDLNKRSVFINPDNIIKYQSEQPSPEKLRVQIDLIEGRSIFTEDSLNDISHRIKIAYKERIEPRR